MNHPAPAWLDRPGLTISLAEVRSSLAFAAGLAEREKPKSPVVCHKGGNHAQAQVRHRQDALRGIDAG